MAQKLLKFAHGVAFACLVCGAGVPEGVAAKFLRKPRCYTIFLNDIRNTLLGEASSLVVEKDMLVCSRRAVFEVNPQCLGRFLLKVNRSLLIAFSVYQHGSLVQINI
jgi:hypothetical protein